MNDNGEKKNVKPTAITTPSMAVTNGRDGAMVVVVAYCALFVLTMNSNWWVGFDSYDNDY